MNWIDRVALESMLGAPEGAHSVDDLKRLAANDIAEHLTAAARLWVLAYPEEAEELRGSNGATSTNKFLSLAENASGEAANVRMDTWT